MGTSTDHFLALNNFLAEFHLLGGLREKVSRYRSGQTLTLVLGDWDHALDPMLPED